MTEFVPYTTQNRDRWDLISLKHYGTPWEFERIIRENPTVPIRPILDPGIELAIPIIERVGSSLSERLPPWKRST